MSMMSRLVRLDQHVISTLRQDGESAEHYLRRAANMYRLRHNDFGRALSEHFAQLDAERAERE